MPYPMWWPHHSWKGVFPDKLKMARTRVSSRFTKVALKRMYQIVVLYRCSQFSQRYMRNWCTSGSWNTQISRYNILCENQYGFRSGRSCEHALLNAQHTVLDTLNNKQVALMLLIDYSKDFDLVEYTVILSKLHHYGSMVSGEWFKS